MILLYPSRTFGPFKSFALILHEDGRKQAVDENELKEIKNDNDENKK